MARTMAHRWWWLAATSAALYACGSSSDSGILPPDTGPVGGQGVDSDAGEPDAGQADAESMGGGAGGGRGGGASGGSASGGEGGAGGMPVTEVPQIVEAQAYLNLEDGAFGITFVGTDAESDVASFTLELWDQRGNQYQLTEMNPAIDLQFTSLRQGLTDWIGFFSFSFLEDSRFRDIGRVRITVVDEGMHRSEPYEPPIGETPVIADGEDCDPNRAVNQCEEGTLCGTVAGGRLLCKVDDPECPAFYDVIDLTLQPNWRYLGNTTGEGSHGRGRCGGGAGDRPFSFTATEAGTYRFRTELPTQQSDSLIWARSHCTFVDWRAQLACNDDIDTEGGVLASAVVLDLNVDETVYLFVDGFLDPETMQGWQGPFTLVAERVYPPVLEDATVIMHARGTQQTLAIRVDGTDENQDVAFIEYALLDVEGNLAWGPTQVRANAWYDDDAFLAAWSGRIDPPLEDPMLATDAILAAVDADGFPTAVVRVPLSAPETVGSGEACQLISAFTKCDGDDVCAVPDDAPDSDKPEDPGRGTAAERFFGSTRTGVCDAPVVECRNEAGWETGDLNAAADGDAWVVDGDLTGNSRFLTTGTCGGGAGPDIYTFTAPAAGVYTFTSVSEQAAGDTVLYARTHCRFGGDAFPEFEIACNDNIDPANRFSQLTLELEAEAQVFVFVDGSGDPAMPQEYWQGSYSLTVRPAPVE